MPSDHRIVNIEEYSQGRPARAPLELVRFEQITAALDTDDLIEGFLGVGTTAVVCGQPGTGKTFVGLDVALHAAQGIPWFGRACEHVGVIYVAAEGSYGARNRIAAFRTKRGLDDAVLPFAMVPGQLNLLDPAEDVARLIDATNEAARSFEAPVRLIIIDTLSRVLFGGDENSPEDMGALVANIDAIRAATNATVLLIHHQGKDESRGPRGHSLLLAAVDTVIEIERDAVSGIGTISVSKQRDMAIGSPHDFTLEVVDLGQNKRGKSVTSCVVIEADRSGKMARSPKSTDEEIFALRQLGELLASPDTEDVIPEAGMVPVKAVKRDAARAWLIARGVIDAADGKAMTNSQRSKLHRLIEALRTKGRIGVHGPWLWIIP